MLLVQYPSEGFTFDFIKKMFSPVEYWENEVAERKEMVEFYRKQVISCKLEFEKLKQTKHIIIRQNMLDGMSRKEAMQDFKNEWKNNKLTCKIFQEIYDIEKAELKKARVELEKARNRNN